MNFHGAGCILFDMTGRETSRNRTITILAIYAVAMGLLEAAVVVYLRELYYPQGFSIQSVWGLAVIPQKIMAVEYSREAATIVMLAAVALLAFRETSRRLWAFLFAFSAWDIAYYVFLYIFLGWPPALTTLDVYFLIPFPWIGPVWIPLLLFSVLGAFSFSRLRK